MTTAHDADLAEHHNPVSDVLDTGIDYMLSLGGYSGERRGGVQGGDGDNDYYRKNADWMPGWGNTFGLPGMDPNNVPSGATAQDRATNYVGHDDPDGIWNGVRNNLMTNESAAHTADMARGDDHMSFTELYDAHVKAYADAQDTGNPQRAAEGKEAAGNTFIDPASFGLAVYGAPLLEHLGVDTGPLTGASIDMFNDPTDTVGDGWAKRMALAGGEMGVGAGAMGKGALDMVTGSPLTGGAEMLGGAALAGVGAFSGIYNTATALGNGMTLDNAVDGVEHLGGSLAKAGGKVVDDVEEGASNLASDAWSGIKSIF